MMNYIDLDMKKTFHTLALACGLLLAGCARLVDIGPPTDSLAGEHIYADDASARAALNGIYIQFVAEFNGFANASASSVTLLAGCSADEFLPTGSSTAATWFFHQHALHPEIQALTNMWADLWRFVFRANNALEGLSVATSLTPELRDQLLGEALFIRAFCYFYLVNLWGDVPLALTTNYRQTNQLPRSPVAEVYAQIASDLRQAKTLLPPGYAHAAGERVRPSRQAAAALLARVSLYTGEWADAETQAAEVIADGAIYLLVPLAEAFLRNSGEAIWQLVPPNFTTNEGNAFIPPNATSLPPAVALSPQVLGLFHADDLRAAQWIGQTEALGDTYHYPYKYKIRGNTQAHVEYSMVLRLAEQYLIRGEARVRQGNLAGARADVDAIRGRAGLGSLPEGMDQQQLLDEIADERSRELFAEWGHRWLDLKRTGRVDVVLQAAKPGLWQSYQQWYPIPRVDIDRNINLHQNEGYSIY